MKKSKSKCKQEVVKLDAELKYNVGKRIWFVDGGSDIAHISARMIDRVELLNLDDGFWDVYYSITCHVYSSEEVQKRLNGTYRQENGKSDSVKWFENEDDAVKYFKELSEKI